MVFGWLVSVRDYGNFGVAESGDDFTKFSTISQWFQTLILPHLCNAGIFSRLLFADWLSY
ncbi:MAG: hypothetical protein HRU34_04495 [Richelia sp.]|nr:hypothetical protein [Richelia sp.]